MRILYPSRHALPAVDVERELLGPDVLPQPGPGGHQLGPRLRAELQPLLQGRESLVQARHLAGKAPVGLVSALLQVGTRHSFINSCLGQL